MYQRFAPLPALYTGRGDYNSPTQTCTGAGSWISPAITALQRAWRVSESRLRESAWIVFPLFCQVKFYPGCRSQIKFLLFQEGVLPFLHSSLQYKPRLLALSSNNHKSLNCIWRVFISISNKSNWHKFSQKENSVLPKRKPLNGKGYVWLKLTNTKLKLI